MTATVHSVGGQKSRPPAQSPERADGDIARQDPNKAVLAFLVAVAVLVTAFKFPPLLDYPNHYARLWLLSGGIAQAPFPEIYTLGWNSAFTNVGIDLMARWLGPVLGVSLLARLLLFLAIVLPPLGAIALHQRLFGGAYHWQIAMLSLAWCATMIGGFINFQIGLGMALLFAAADWRMQQKNRRLGLFFFRLVAALLLTVMHLFSVGFYLALVFGLEFSADFSSALRQWRSLALRLVLAVVTCAIPPLLLYLQAPVLPRGSEAGLDASWNNSPALVVMNLLSAIWTYVALVDLVFLIPILLVCYHAVRTRHLRLHAGLSITALGLLVIACVCPRHMMGTGWVSWRFPIMAALAAMVMICPLPNLRRRQALLLAAVLVIAVFGRTAWIGYVWWQGAADAADVEAVLADVPPGSAILPLQHRNDANPLAHIQRHFAWGQDTFRHLPTLGVPDAHAFVPTLFAARGKQPLTVLPPWSGIAVAEGNLLSTGLLLCPTWLRQDTANTPYLDRWRERFDMVLVVNADVPDQYVGDAMPSGLTLVSQRPFARLYRIDKSATSAAQPVVCPDPLPPIE